MTAHLIAEEGLLQGLLFPLDEGTEWILGRSPDSADLIIDDSTVSRKHAGLSKESDGIHLKNFSKINPTLVNGEEFRGDLLLKEGDRIQIGETTFLFSSKKKAKPKKKTASYDDIFDELNVPEEEKSLPSEKSLDETKLGFEKEDTSSYDTIFEDPSESQQVPFNIPSETPFLLKVVSGPNGGAEIGIERGHTYTLGKDAVSCDILFQDLSVSRMHARLSISVDGVITIADLGSKNKTTINGVPVEGEQIVTSQDLIALGTTVFVIIEKDEPQETIFANFPLASSEEDLVEEEKKNKDWKKEKIPLRHLVLAGSIFTVFLVGFVTFFSLFKSSQIELVHKEPVSEIKDALSGTKFSGIEFSFNPASGKLFLVGHVLSNVDYQEMRYSLSLIPFIMNIEDTVVIDEGVCKNMNDVLNGNNSWKGISIRPVSPGKFALLGYLQTNAEMAEISDYLNINFPYLDRLEYKVTVEEVLNTELGSMLFSTGFSAVSYQLSNGEVVLSGVYDHRKEKQFHELVKHLQHLPAITSVKDFAIPTSPNLAAINLTSQYQVSGISLHDKKGFNAILNGKIYTLGDLVDGMHIIDIEDNLILLEKDGVKYKIDYTQRG